MRRWSRAAGILFGGAQFDGTAGCVRFFRKYHLMTVVELQTEEIHRFRDGVENSLRDPCRAWCPRIFRVVRVAAEDDGIQEPLMIEKVGRILFCLKRKEGGVRECLRCCAQVADARQICIDPPAGFFCQIGKGACGSDADNSIRNGHADRLGGQLESQPQIGLISKSSSFSSFRPDACSPAPMFKPMAYGGSLIAMYRITRPRKCAAIPVA